MRVRTRSTHAPRRQAKNALRSRALRRRRAIIRRVGLYWFVANPFRDYEGFLMAKSCPFCDQRKIAARVFRDHGRWCSLLAAPHITKGHAIVSVKAGGAGCPTEINSDILSGLDTALADVSSALMAFYQPKRVLFASLRGHVEHVHFHAVPLWKDEEAQWRNEVGYQSGHLLEFLGHLEKREFARREAIMKERGLGNEQYRAEIQSALLPDVQRLREYTRYTPA